MTVEELLQELVELCQRGRAKWEVGSWGLAYAGEMDWIPIDDLTLDDHLQRITLHE